MQSICKLYIIWGGDDNNILFAQEIYFVFDQYNHFILMVTNDKLPKTIDL